MMENPTKWAARMIADAEKHAAVGNLESASRLLGALARGAHVARDVRAADAAARRLGVTLYAFEMPSSPTA